MNKKIIYGLCAIIIFVIPTILFFFSLFQNKIITTNKSQHYQLTYKESHAQPLLKVFNDMGVWEKNNILQKYTIHTVNIELIDSLPERNSEKMSLPFSLNFRTRKKLFTDELVILLQVNQSTAQHVKETVLSNMVLSEVIIGVYQSTHPLKGDPEQYTQQYRKYIKPFEDNPSLNPFTIERKQK